MVQNMGPLLTKKAVFLASLTGWLSHRLLISTNQLFMGRTLLCLWLVILGLCFSVFFNIKCFQSACYLLKGGYIINRVWLFIRKTTEKLGLDFGWNFQDISTMALVTDD